MIKTDTERNRKSEYSHYMKETEFIIKPSQKKTSGPNNFTSEFY